MQAAIKVRNLSKKYLIGHSARSYRTLRDALVNAALGPLRRLRKVWNRSIAGAQNGDESFWALQDVSFDILPGEVVGIIGRNGAGKSTLLKTLSRITEPTSGRIELSGRVGSLLEVGTGFHNELTGRENIYLNGAILGMTRQEIRHKFDEIVAFAEMEQFLDMPVKRYSSGMYMRLAFAVAAHLDPEILIVDEVLAVGDVEYQKKCLGKMNDVAVQGRTVLFVSHNMSAVQRLCTRALVMYKGSVQHDSPVAQAVMHYLETASDAPSRGQWMELADHPRRGTGRARFVSFRCRSGVEEMANCLFPDGPAEVELAIDSDQARTISQLSVTFYDRYGSKLVNADSISLGNSISLHPGTNRLRVKIESLHLNPGSYILGLFLGQHLDVLDHIESAALIDIQERQNQGLGRRTIADGYVPCSFSVTSC